MKIFVCRGKRGQPLATCLLSGQKIVARYDKNNFPLFTTREWSQRNSGVARVFDIFCPGNRQIRDEGGAGEGRERVGEGSECRGTSVSDVQISVRHCSDVIVVNTHSDGLRRGWRNY